MANVATLCMSALVLMVLIGIGVVVYRALYGEWPS
jgi:hypothetical protein